MSPGPTRAPARQQQLFTAPATALLAHGPGCKPITAHNFKQPGQPRYICVPCCPRQRALTELGYDELAEHVAQTQDEGRLFLVASLADIAASKRAAGRPKDIEALPELDRLLNNDP